MRRLTVGLLLACACGAEVVDRVAANIGRRVITADEVEEEARVTAFSEAQPVDLSPANQRKVLDRLVDQFLIRRELEFTHFAPIGDEEAAPVLKQIRDRYATEEEFQKAIVDYGVTAESLKKHVSWAITVLRFIEYRFQPAVQITPAQIRQEYNRRATQWKENIGAEAPPLEKIQPEIEKMLRQRLVDAALDRWLGEVRTQNQIVYHEGYKL